MKKIFLGVLLIAAQTAFAQTHCPKGSLPLSQAGVVAPKLGNAYYTHDEAVLDQLNALAASGNVFLVLKQDLTYDNSDTTQSSDVYSTNDNWCAGNCAHISVAEANSIKGNHGAAVLFSMGDKLKDYYARNGYSKIVYKAGHKIPVTSIETDETLYEQISKRVIFITKSHKNLSRVSLVEDRRVWLMDFLTGEVKNKLKTANNVVEVCVTKKVPAPKTLEMN